MKEFVFDDRKYHKNIEQLQRAMDKVQSKGSTVEQYLSSVLSTVCAAHTIC